MIKIDYSTQEIAGQPGPNIYFTGVPSDYLKLVIDLHNLGYEIDKSINMAEFDYVHVSQGFAIECRSSISGRTLNKIGENTILIDLTTELWRTFLIRIFSISFYASHIYVDFDGLNLIEDANLILSSEI